MNKKNELQKSLFGSTLWNIWIWLTIVLVCLADINVVVSLAIEGVSGWHLAIPIVFLALDVVLAFVAAFSNFRFRYSLVFPVVYAAFTVVMGIAGIVVYCAILDYIVFTNFALVSWMIFELLSVATILLSTVRASGRGTIFSIMTAVLVVIFAAYSIFYVVIVARDGFFGQGKSGSYSSEERTTTYKYDEETDTYIASGTLSGRGGTVLVSDSVNGKKVGEVDCSIFLGDGITGARLLCDGDVKFSNTECIASLPDDFIVTASKDSVDDLKTYFYELSLETAEGAVATYDAYTDSLCEAYADFANRITPEVEEDETYIVFTYSYGGLETIGVGNVLPTWIEKSGKTFSVSSISSEVTDPSLYERMDPSNEDNLYYYYTNYDKIILNALCDGDGNSIEGQSITSSMSVEVSYENIYAVSISTNDTVYETTEEFSAISDFESSKYRYVTGSGANDLISEINETANARAGFTYKWTYDDGKTFKSLEDVIEDGIEITLEWTLDAPKISMASSETGTYGDDITLAATSISHGDENITYEYSWEFGGENKEENASYALSRVEPARDSGTYTLTVTASDPANTSLTSSASSSVTLTVSKKTLRFEWTLDGKSVSELKDEDLTYSGLYKTLIAAANTSDIVSGDAVTYAIAITFKQATVESLKDAGTYDFSVSLSNGWGDYYALDSSASSQLTVSPYELEVKWSDETFTFDKQTHVLSYSYTLSTLGDDEISDELLDASVAASEKVNAGTYIAEIIWTNTNYTIIDLTHSFTISPAELTVTAWSADSLTYCGGYQSPKISAYTCAVTVDDGEIEFDYDYSGRDVGEGYVVTAKSLNTNYVIAEGYNSHEYSITAFELAVTWGTETITYDGSEQILSHGYALSSLGTDTITDSLLGVTIDGYGTNAGENAYTAIISWTNKNYELTNTSKSYSIAKRDVSVATWDSDTFNYNGTSQNPVATSFNNLVSGDDLFETYVISAASGGDFAGKNVGSYTVTISINNPNYSLTGEETYSYTITEYELEVIWISESLIYDGTSQVISHSFKISSLGEDTLIDDDLLGASVSGYKDAGEHIAEISWTNPNYRLTNTTCVYVISPAPLTVTWSETSLTYSGEAQRPYISSYSGNVEGETVTFSYSDDGNVNVGEYLVSATCADDNYTITTPECPYTIFAYTLEVVWDTETVLTYDGSAQAPKHGFSLDTLGKDTNIDDDLLGVTVSGYGTNAGENVYTAEISWTNKNYKLTNTSKVFSIAKRDVSVATWDSDTFTYNGTSQNPVATSYSDLVAGDDLHETYTISGDDEIGKDVGSYVVTIFIANDNYNLTGDTTYDYTVTPCTLEVIWGTETLIYDGTEQAPSHSFSMETLGGDEISDDLLGVDLYGRQTNAGSGYEALITCTNPNYTLTNTSVYFSILQKTLTVSWDENDANLTYSGMSQHPEAAIGGVPDEDKDGFSVTYTVAGDNLTGDESINVGSYTVTIVSVNNSNYALPSTNLSFDYSILPMEIEAEWGDISFTYDGTDHYSLVTCTVMGAGEQALSSTITVTLDDTVTSLLIYAGSYIATVEIVDPDVARNYVIANDTQEIVVAKASLTISWEGADLVYDGTAKLPAVSYADGEVYDGDEVKLILVDENEDLAIGYTNAGSYTVYAKSDNPNYEVTGENSYTFTIARASLTVEWGETSFIYNGSAIAVTCTAVGANGETIDLTVTITDSNGNAVLQVLNAGSYTATVSISDSTTAGNYVITNDVQKIVVAKAVVNVEWSGGKPSFTWSEGSIDAEIAEITCSYEVKDEFDEWQTATDITQAGTYRATLTISSINYEFALGAEMVHQFTVE